MDYERRALFILQASFLIVFLPVVALVGKGVLKVAENQAAAISAIDMGRTK